MLRALAFLAFLTVAPLFTVPGAHADNHKTATVFKSPYCGCCGGYVNHMRANGWKVEVKDFDDIEPLKKMMGIPPHMASCHTTKVGDYLVEGHVPLNYVEKMLAEKPKIRGISLPGMPTGVPGMEGERVPLTIYTLEAEPKVYATRD